MNITVDMAMTGVVVGASIFLLWCGMGDEYAKGNRVAAVGLGCLGLGLATTMALSVIA